MEKGRVFLCITVIAVFFILFTRFYSARAASGVIITEVAASPAADHEWIEVYNRGSEPVDLQSWKFWEQGVNHGIKYFSGHETLASQSFAIIAQDAATFLAGYPNFQGTLYDSSWGSLKETGEEIGLRDASGTLAEVFVYQPAPVQFLQRKDPLLDDYGAENWQESVATPGVLFEQTAAVEENVAEDSVEPIVSNPVQPLETENSATSTPEIAVSTQPTQEETITPTSTPQTAPAPRVVTESAVTVPIVASVPSTISASLNYSWGVVWINEFVSDPVKGEEEWVELKSNSINAIDLKGWFLVDAGGAKTVLSGVLPAFGYKVVEKPKGSLNNSGDKVILVDSQGTTIDAVPYGDFETELFSIKNPPAPKKGFSLARVSEQTSSGNPVFDFALTESITKGTKNSISVLVPLQEAEKKPGKVISVAKTPEIVPFVVSSTAYNASVLQETCVTGTVVVGTAVQESEQVVSIEEAREKSAGSDVVVRGFVTALPGSISPYYFYIEENGHGMQVYSYHKQFPKVFLGSNVEVRGEISLAYGSPRVKIKSVDDVIVEKTTHAIQPSLITEVIDDMDGVFVAFEGEVVEKNAREFVVSTAASEIIIKMSKEKIPELKVGALVRVLGVVVVKNGAVSVVPRGATDVQVVGSVFDSVAATTTQVLNTEIAFEEHAAQPKAVGSKDTVTFATLGGLAGGGIGAYAIKKALAMLLK